MSTHATYLIYITPNMEFGIVPKDGFLGLETLPEQSTHNSKIERLFDFITPPRQVTLFCDNDIEAEGDRPTFYHPLSDALLENPSSELTLNGTILFDGSFSISEAEVIRDFLDYKFCFCTYGRNMEMDR